MAGNLIVALAGDVMLARLVNSAIYRYGPAYPWGDALPYLTQADLTIINLECVITDRGQPFKRWPKKFIFDADPVALQTLQLAGISCVSLANNHVLDYETEGLLDMFDRLDSAGIARAGAGRNVGEAMKAALLDSGGIKVGVVAFTDNEPGWAATESEPGINWISVSLAEGSLAPVRDAIGRARWAGADIVIFSMHWGPNMVVRPCALFQDFAHRVVDAGADLFYGQSAHIFQGIEIYKGKPIIYDAGDFVDDYMIDPDLRNDRGLLFLLHLNKSGVQQLELIPTLISNCQVNIAKGYERNAIAARISMLSEELHTKVQWQHGRIWIVFTPAIKQIMCPRQEAKKGE